jgi:hypothetical protein
MRKKNTLVELGFVLPVERLNSPAPLCHIANIDSGTSRHKFLHTGVHTEEFCRMAWCKAPCCT